MKLESLSFHAPGHEAMFLAWAARLKPHNTWRFKLWLEDLFGAPLPPCQEVVYEDEWVRLILR